MSQDVSGMLVNALVLPTILIDRNERICVANTASEAILGGGLIDRHYITVLRQPALLDAITSVFHGGPSMSAGYISRDGEKDVVYRVFVAAAGDNIVLSFEDQTAVQEGEQMRRDFVANVSHELRTPLTALLGFIETLGGAARDDAVARDRFLGIMEREARRMTHLVEDLLSLSRVEEEERIRPRESVDIAALLSSVVKGLEPQLKKAGATISLLLDDDNNLVPGDGDQLAQVFTNLIENAIKYGASGGTVLVQQHARTNHLMLRDEGVEISITDHGEGIAAHHIPRLTERFYRVDSHRSREVGGTGLGLAIVKHIVNRHRGRFVIESEVGEGTRMAVILPTN